MPCCLVGGTGVGTITRGMLRGGMRKERLKWKKDFSKARLHSLIFCENLYDYFGRRFIIFKLLIFYCFYNII